MEQARPLTVLIAESIPLTRLAVATIMNTHSQSSVCVEAVDGPNSRRLCSEKLPDLIVLNLTIARGDDLGLVREFQRLHPPTRTLVISEWAEPTVVGRAFRAGAKAFLLTRDEPEELRAAVTAVLAGELYTSRSIGRLLLHGLASAGPPRAKQALETLSDREMHVLRLMGCGYGATALARELGLSVKTVETHQQRMKEKLQLRSTADLQRRASEWMWSLQLRRFFGEPPLPRSRKKNTSAAGSRRRGGDVPKRARGSHSAA